jgi:hypothetical protein
MAGRGYLEGIGIRQTRLRSGPDAQLGEEARGGKDGDHGIAYLHVGWLHHVFDADARGGLDVGRQQPPPLEERVDSGQPAGLGGGPRVVGVEVRRGLAEDQVIGADEGLEWPRARRGPGMKRDAGRAEEREDAGLGDV